MLRMCLHGQAPGIGVNAGAAPCERPRR
jgi:hypothetical protein